MSGISRVEPIGMEQGAARVILLQIEQRFGSVPDWVKDKVANANMDDLDLWAVKIIDSYEIEAIFQKKIQKKPYITSVERIGMEKGEKIGVSKYLHRLIEQRFGSVPDWVKDKMATLDIDSLYSLIGEVLDANSMEAIFQQKALPTAIQ